MNKTLDRLKQAAFPYVITGSHASFQYHHWLLPVANILEVRIHPEDLSSWVQTLRAETIYVDEKPPTSKMMKDLEGAVVLSKSLTREFYDRKRIIANLCYESPEDLCLEFLKSIATETASMEILALLLAQRRGLQWEYFSTCLLHARLGREAGILLDVINEHTRQSLMPLAISCLPIATSPFTSTFASAICPVFNNA
ncbi:MAG: hypothetical protein AAB354_06550 [candidate division KSB1 bacterium]